MILRGRGDAQHSSSFNMNHRPTTISVDHAVVRKLVDAFIATAYRLLIVFVDGKHDFKRVQLIQINRGTGCSPKGLPITGAANRVLQLHTLHRLFRIGVVFEDRCRHCHRQITIASRPCGKAFLKTSQ